MTGSCAPRDLDSEPQRQEHSQQEHHRPAGTLEAWLYGEHIANLAPAGELADLTWTDATVERWGLGSRIVSNLFPTGRGGVHPHPRAVTVFLQGLLAEGNLREHLAFEASLSPDDVFGMVSAYGRDTAGALVFLPAGEGPEDRVGAVELMADTDIAMHAHQHIVGLGSAGRVCRPASMAGPRGRPAGPGRARSPCHVAFAADFNSRHTKGAAHRGSCPPCGNRPSGLSGSGPRQGKPAPLPPAHRKVHDA